MNIAIYARYSSHSQTEQSIEQMGTGINRMKNAAREANVAKPKFEFTGFFKVTFKRHEVDTSIDHQTDMRINGKNHDLLGASEQVNEQDTEQVTRGEKILEFCFVPRTRDEIQEFVGISHREHFRAKILKPLLDTGQLRMTIPEKPNSRNQKYVRA